MKEADLVKKIRQYLKTIPELFYWKEHGGQYETAGIPDLIFYMVQKSKQKETIRKRKETKSKGNGYII